jgi:hypothetical protein
MENTLYYGDNLDILKRYISDESNEINEFIDGILDAEEEKP